MSNEKKPHAAVILLKIEVHEVLKSGELSGKPLSKKELKEFGIPTSAIATVKGFDKFDCMKNLKQKLLEIQA